MPLSSAAGGLHDACPRLCVSPIERFPYIGPSTSAATIRRTRGATNRKTGKATAHDMAQATGQTEKKFGAKPIERSVEIPDTMHVIISDTMTAVSSCA